MGRRLIVNNKCPICGSEVEVVMDAVLKKNPHYHNVEMVMTRRGLKQYIHSDCWYEAIREKKPYDGKMYI